MVEFDMAGRAAPQNPCFLPESEFVLDRIFEFVLDRTLCIPMCVPFLF
jgi:hypothetical protein